MVSTMVWSTSLRYGREWGETQYRSCPGTTSPTPGPCPLHLAPATSLPSLPNPHLDPPPPPRCPQPPPPRRPLRSNKLRGVAVPSNPVSATLAAATDAMSVFLRWPRIFSADVTTKEVGERGGEGEGGREREERKEEKKGR